MDRLQAMTVFLAVVDTGGFASAARKLQVSPSVISRIVGELEDDLGVRLVTRTTRMVRMTAAGDEYAERCRRILADIEDAAHAAAGMHAVPRGLLTITSSVMFGRMFITPMVTAYLTQYPEVHAECWFLDRIVNMVEEGVDVAIRLGEQPDSSLQAVKVGSVRRVVCGAPQYLERHGAPQRPDDLDAHTLIASSGSISAREWRFMDNGEAVSKRVQPRFIPTSNEAALDAALSGFGLTRLLSYQVAQHVADGHLKIVLADCELPPLPIQVMHREGRHPSAKVRAFLDLAIDTLRAEKSIR
jgi:DNA-binding transcriptional LysR family regulator